MSQQVILNGKMSSIAPDEAVIINKVASDTPPIINGLMPFDVNINGLTRMPTPTGCVLDLPLYHSALSPASLKSVDANKHTCSVYGALWTPQGRKFDGTDDNIALPTSAGLTPATGTIILWLKLSNLADSGYVFSSNANELSIYHDGAASLDFYYDSGSLEIAIPRKASITEFACYGYTFTQGGTVNGYKDGIASGTPATISSTAPTESLPKLMSGHNNTLWLAGILGHFMMFNRVLTAYEIQRIYLATRWRFR